MSTFSQFFKSTLPPTGQTPIGGVTLTGQTQVSLGTTAGCEVMLSGALTADTYKSLESYSGKGFFSFAGVRSPDATSRTVSIKLILDGTEFEASASTSSTDLGAILIGGAISSSGASPSVNLETIAFNSSFDIQVKSSDGGDVEAVIKYWKVS